MRTLQHCQALGLRLHVGCSGCGRCTWLDASDLLPELRAMTIEHIARAGLISCEGCATTRVGVCVYYEGYNRRQVECWPSDAPGRCEPLLDAEEQAMRALERGSGKKERAAARPPSER